MSRYREDAFNDAHDCVGVIDLDGILINAKEGNSCFATKDS